MTGLSTILAFMAPCIAAIGIARFAQSRIAKRILIAGGLFFLIVMLLTFIFGQQCIGGLLQGFSECKPAMLTPLAQTLASPLLISFVGYTVAGPAILLAAALFEILKRRAG